tara:strand:- start:132 stop:395 length:264 start_codon:yes stop_codon:yes gene_type:complete
MSELTREKFYNVAVSDNPKGKTILEGLRKYSASCRTDADLLKQWSVVDQDFTGQKMTTECGMTTTDLVKIYNSETKLSAFIGKLVKR